MDRTDEDRATEGAAIDVVRERLRRIAGAEVGPTFWGWPDRWWDAFLRRCPNDHVSKMTQKPEALGRDACLACMAPVTMTFPEDRDGPLVDPA